MICPMDSSLNVADHGADPMKDSVVWIFVNFRGIDFAVKLNDIG